MDAADEYLAPREAPRVVGFKPYRRPAQILSAFCVAFNKRQVNLMWLRERVANIRAAPVVSRGRRRQPASGYLETRAEPARMPPAW